MTDWRRALAEREANEHERDLGREEKLKRAQRLLNLRIKATPTDRRKLHFRWKKFRLSLCVGGTVIAAWPSSVDGAMLALIQTKMMGKQNQYPFLSSNQKHVRSMMLKLRDALLRAEDGPRHRTVYRQRVRLDKLLFVPKKVRPMGRWTCNCQTEYAQSVRACLYCHKKAPRERK